MSDLDRDHDKRVTELLAANNGEVERRRTAERRAGDLEQTIQILRQALLPFARVEERMLLGPQMVRGFADSLPDDQGEFCTIGDDSGYQSIRRAHFRSALAAIQHADFDSERTSK